MCKSPGLKLLNIQNRSFVDYFNPDILLTDKLPTDAQCQHAGGGLNHPAPTDTHPPYSVDVGQPIHHSVAVPIWLEPPGVGHISPNQVPPLQPVIMIK